MADSSTFGASRGGNAFSIARVTKRTIASMGIKGLRYSIFQGERQIAAFTKNRIVVGKGNQYEISLNDDADVIVIICIVLAINTSEDDDDNATVTIDVGSIGPEEKPFDERWQPS
jgi:hypothetical protein